MARRIIELTNTTSPRSRPGATDSEPFDPNSVASLLEAIIQELLAIRRPQPPTPHPEGTATPLTETESPTTRAEANREEILALSAELSSLKIQYSALTDRLEVAETSKRVLETKYRALKEGYEALQDDCVQQALWTKLEEAADDFEFDNRGRESGDGEACPKEIQRQSMAVGAGYMLFQPSSHHYQIPEAVLGALRVRGRADERGDRRGYLLNANPLSYLHLARGYTATGHKICCDVTPLLHQIEEVAGAGEFSGP